MTSYSLSSDSRRWWWPSAAAGTVGAAAITAILALPGAVQAVPMPDGPDGTATDVVGDGVVNGDGSHQCFMFRASWNEALDGFQPECGDADPVARDSLGARRAGMDYLP